MPFTRRPRARERAAPATGAAALLLVAAACADAALAAAVGQASGGALEVEIGADMLAVRPQPDAAGGGRRRAESPSVTASSDVTVAQLATASAAEVRGEEALLRRETAERETAAAGEAARLREGAASQDGAMPYFIGSWNGYRNNWYGDVGISFVPQKDFTIVALGRHRHNESGLQQTVPVTLWSVETQMQLGIVNVGPHSFHEGHYHWEPIDAPGIAVSQGREYRLTQACTPNMIDKWFDRTVSFEQVEANAATGFARFVGGVNQSGFGFPVYTNGQFRRPGMVNFKMKPPPVRIGNIEDGARRAADVQSKLVVFVFWCVLTATFARP